MTDLFRSPVAVNRREFAPVLALGTAITVVSSLLATTLTPLPVPLPLSAARSFPLQQIRQPPSQNQSTAAGIPDSARPSIVNVFRAPTFATAGDIRLRFNGDTSQGTSAALRTFIPLRLIVPPPFEGPKYPRYLNADTSQETPKVLTLDSVQSNPAPSFSTIAYRWLNADTTLGTPAALRAIAPPFRPVAHLFAPIAYRWLNADATQDMSSEVRSAAAPLPPGRAAPTLAPVVRLLLGADTTQDMASPLRALAPPVRPFAHLLQGPQFRLQIMLEASWRGILAGTIYNVSFTEAGAASDATDDSLVAADAISETASAADSGDCAPVWACSTSDAASAGDSESAGLVAAASMAEAGSASDAPTGSAVEVASISESVSAADFVDSGSGHFYSVDVTESGSASDALADSVAAVASIAETGAAADIFLAVMFDVVSLAESGAARDSWDASGGSLIELIRDQYFVVLGGQRGRFTFDADRGRFIVRGQRGRFVRS